MGKITVICNLTLDGVMQAPGRAAEDTRDGFEYGGWATPYSSDAMGRLLGDTGRASLLLGRRTYADFADFWPKQDPNPYTEALDKQQKYVVSTTLTEPLPWANSTVVKAADIAELKQSQNLLIFGSGVLINSIQDQIDEYKLLIHPLTLGTGRRLFTDHQELRLTDTVTTTTGVVIGTYLPKLSGDCGQLQGGVVAGEGEGRDAGVRAEGCADREVARDAADAVGEEARGEEVGRHGDSAGTAARAAGVSCCAGEDLGQAFACAGDVADLYRAVDAFGEQRGGGGAVEEGATVRRTGGGEDNTVDRSQVHASGEAVDENVGEDGIRTESASCMDQAGPPIRLAGDVHRSVIPAAQQQRHHHRFIAISNHSVDQPGQRRYVDIHEPQRDRQLRPLCGHQPNQRMHLTNTPRIRSSMGSCNQINSHDGAPTGSTARR